MLSFGKPKLQILTTRNNTTMRTITIKIPEDIENELQKVNTCSETFILEAIREKLKRSDNSEQSQEECRVACFSNQGLDSEEDKNATWESL